MEPEQRSSLTEMAPSKSDSDAASAAADTAGGPVNIQDLGASQGLGASQELKADPGPEPVYRGLRWIFAGSEGLRTGWSVLMFLILAILFMFPLGFLGNLIARSVLHLKSDSFTPASAILQELVLVLAILGAGTILAFIERRRLFDYNLTGPRGGRHFMGGLAAGFVGLSVLVGGLAMGGWLQFGPVALSGSQIFGFAALWGGCFLLVGFFEEGTFRCYLQFTLARGINFWWALGIEAALCLDLVLRDKGDGVWGVYGIVLLGLVPCLLLQLRKAEGGGFWQAAWVTSTVFGFIHTSNNGENWIGIFAAGTIGFVFCVSIWVTGSAWWAIGCHAGWDWAETYFFGTADSGLPAKGHYLTTSPAGNVLWSGGTDGPEGSLLVLGVILLLLVALLLIYGRRRVVATVAVPSLRQVEG
ncbi:MAG TPA: CPBP family intramembrane glutamic endopeptidase [Terracidiphilus sp.]|nr:CPBP family intramembrane glutamic endopeptidase [Terracidiphilus sp.]